MFALSRNGSMTMPKVNGTSESKLMWLKAISRVWPKKLVLLVSPTCVAAFLELFLHRTLLGWL